MRPCGFMPPGRFCVLMGLLRVMLARSHSPVPLPAAFVSVTRQPVSYTHLDVYKRQELYRLLHSINSLAAVLNAHADNELREKEFLKNTISDISHQLKTPLAALNIYNGLLQDCLLYTSRCV